MTIRVILVALLIAQGTFAAAARSNGAASSPSQPAAPTIAENQTGSNQEPGKKGSRYAKPLKKEPIVQSLTGMVEWEYKPLSWDCDVPNCDHFALYDDATHRNYELDDARAALPFEGRRAKVIGVVDTKNSTIHVVSVEPAQ